MTVNQLHEGVYTPIYATRVEVLRIESIGDYAPPQIHQISDSDKTTTLFQLGASNTHGQSLLKAFTDFQFAHPFSSKDQASEGFKFKLCCPKPVEQPDKLNASQFVALSYTCHNENWQVRDTGGNTNKASISWLACPLAPAMWNAFLDSADAHYFWVDQYCIDQEDEAEKELAIGAMDRVYKAAAKVIVALEDIALEPEEVAALLEYAAQVDQDVEDSKRNSSSLKLTATAFGKILKARWLQRAWCMHEFNISRKHIFLIPIMAGDATVTVPSILRMDSTFLTLISGVYVDEDMSYRERGLSSPLTDPLISQAQIANAVRFIDRVKYLSMYEVFGSDKVDSDGSYMNMYSEVFSLGSRYVSDRLAILLNVMDSGVFYRGIKEIEESDCCLLATLLALTARDATSLCASGLPIERKGFSWVRMPTVTDRSLPPGVTRAPEIRNLDARIIKEGLEIDVVPLCKISQIRSADEVFLSWAKLLVDWEATTRRPRPVNLLLDFEDDKLAYDELHSFYVQALACALECGKDWMLQYDELSAFNLPTGVYASKLAAGWYGGYDDRHQKVFSDAIDLAFYEMSLDEILPETNQEVQDSLAVGSMVSQTGSSTSPAQVHPGDFDDVHIECCYWFLLKFANDLVAYGLNVAPKADRQAFTQSYAVQVMNYSDEAPPSIVFTPMFDENDADRIELCVPYSLSDPDYRWMAKGWVLKASTGVPNREVFELLHKTRIATVAGSDTRKKRSKRILVV